MTQRTDQHKELLTAALGDQLQRDVPLAPFTAARVGGKADVLVVAHSVDHLAEIGMKLMEMEIPFLVLGGGSNVLVSDAGVREVVVLNRAKESRIDPEALSLWAGSGASFGQLARKVSARGFHGLEWAAGIPGTVGGAVYGNAGAHGGDVAGNLRVAEILHPSSGRVNWTADQMGYAYRSSLLKRDRINAVILSAEFGFENSTVAATKKLLGEYSSHRKRTQPPGASMGSMFKNPPADFSGRLIERAGLKGTQIGGAEISPVHANFFISHPGTKAEDILSLIRLVQQKVADNFGIELSLEIELVGDWESENG